MFRAKTEFTHCSSMIAKLSTNRGTQLDILSKAEPPKRPHCLWQLFVHILIIILIGYYHLYYIYCFAILFEIFASTRVYITLSLRISCSEFVKGYCEYKVRALAYHGNVCHTRQKSCAFFK